VPFETVALGPGSGLDSTALQSVVATSALVGVATLEVAPAVPAVGSFGLSELVETAKGPVGLVLIFVYSFLIAFALPGVSEIVLAAPLEMGLSQHLRLTLIILVSSVGKAMGSVLAFHVGQEAKSSGPVERWIRRSRFDVLEWSERSVVRLGRRFGYLGLAAFLSVPGLPDTLSIYAFAVIETDYLKFAVATFVGSVNRLVLTLVGVGLFLSLV
jgi:membrane protein YqaA with SNARE-associated domain